MTSTTAGFDSALPPGAQLALFTGLTGERVRDWRVLTSDGRCHARTASLGVIVTVIRHLVAIGDEGWVISSDGTAARVTPDAVFSSTPDLPWIATLSNTINPKETR